MRDLLRFASAVRREWQALLTGGVMIAALFLVERVAGVFVPRWILLLIALLALLAAAFRVWRIESEARLAADKRVQEPEAAVDLADELVLQISDVDSWLLGRVAKYSLRREFRHSPRSGATTNFLWLGDTAIDYNDSRWFYDLAESARTRGLLESQNGVYRIREEAQRALASGQRKGRKANRPGGTLANGLTGAIETDRLS